MVQIDDVNIFKNEVCPHGGMRISWSGSMGWGQYDLVLQSESEDEFPADDYKLKIIGYSECMDNNEDKKFLKALLEDLVQKIEIVE